MNNFNNPFIPQQPNAQAQMPVVPTDNPTLPPIGMQANPNVFEVDLTLANSTMPEGLYKVKCVGVEQTVSKQENPMFAWNFVVIESEHAGKDLKYYTALTPSSIWKASEVIIALGIGTAGQKIRFTQKDVINKECYAYIEDSEYNGQVRSNISSVMSVAQYNQNKNSNIPF